MRLVSETRKEVIEQLTDGEAGIDVSLRQRNSGVKDAEATYWIEGGKDESKDLGSEMQDMLTVEERENLPPQHLSPNDKINPYLNLEGMYICSISLAFY